jgi:hypothetical protein
MDTRVASSAGLPRAVKGEVFRGVARARAPPKSGCGGLDYAIVQPLSPLSTMLSHGSMAGMPADARRFGLR